MSRLVLVVAGDPSGDVHGGDLVRRMKEVDPALKVAAVGGGALRAQADEFLFDLAALGVTGFWEPFKRLPMFVRHYLKLKQFMTEQRPSAVVCIDYYGFNRWTLKSAAEQAIPTYYYISPQVWASRPGRVQIIKEIVNRMLVIFPFEEELYRNAGVPVSFVGHPLLDRIGEPSPREGIGRMLRVGLLPGSRTSEIQRHLPIFLDALDGIRRNFPKTDAALFAAPHIPDSAYAQASKRGVPVVRESDYAIRSRMDIVLTSSGTATLENALLGLPMVVVYKLSLPTYLIARSLIRVPRIAMANLLAKRALVPELIQRDATPENVAGAALDILGNPQRLNQLRRDLLSLRQTLGPPGAAARAARIILAGIGGTDGSAGISRPASIEGGQERKRHADGAASPPQEETGGRKAVMLAEPGTGP